MGDITTAGDASSALTASVPSSPLGVNEPSLGTASPAMSICLREEPLLQFLVMLVSSHFSCMLPSPHTHSRGTVLAIAVTYKLIF